MESLYLHASSRESQENFGGPPNRESFLPNTYILPSLLVNLFKQHLLEINKFLNHNNKSYESSSIYLVISGI